MGPLNCALDEVRAQALMRLLDNLDYETMRRCAISNQDCFDMIHAMECVRAALTRESSRDAGRVAGGLETDRPMSQRGTRIRAESPASRERT
jgi:hypothetical protein